MGGKPLASDFNLIEAIPTTYFLTRGEKVLAQAERLSR